MTGLPELEEVVGRYWHRLVGKIESYPHHPGAAVELEPLRDSLAVFFRGLGGDGGIRLAACDHTVSQHRGSLRQRLGMGSGERLAQPTLDGESLLLPARLDCFADAALNERLYFWLTAFFVHATGVPRPADPLQADIAALRAARLTTRRTLTRCPGLQTDYADLTSALLDIRPRRSLKGWEAAVEEAVSSLLGGPPPRKTMAQAVLAAVNNPRQDLGPFSAPREYRPFLPVPLWGEITQRKGASAKVCSDQQGGDSGETEDNKRRKANRRSCNQAERDDSLILNRFETMLSLAEMVNINRSVEDDNVDAARQAAEELDEITIGQHQQKAATRLKLDLDLAPEALDARPLSAELSYPEWDYTRRTYHRDHCRVIAEPAEESGEDWQPGPAARRRIRALRRQFEALRPKRRRFPAQSDGDELDLAALVRSFADREAGESGSDRVYSQPRNAVRDLAVAVLVDVSLSTDGWIDNHRVLDVEKEAVTTLVQGLAACGDDHAVYTFTSRKRSWVRVQTVKRFDEPLTGLIERRIQALRPGYYTRIGAALRYVSERLAERPNRHRLLVLLTDGKPNDLDHYEGRYGVEDTRKAIHEARRQGLAVFGVTVDKKARDYFPYLFGRGGYAIVGKIDRLSAALPGIYRQLVG